jgi:hypothetical protein
MRTRRSWIQARVPEEAQASLPPADLPTHFPALAPASRPA